MEQKQILTAGAPAGSVVGPKARSAPSKPHEPPNRVDTSTRQTKPPAGDTDEPKPNEGA